MNHPFQTIYLQGRRRGVGGGGGGRSLETDPAVNEQQFITGPPFTPPFTPMVKCLMDLVP